MGYGSLIRVRGGAVIHQYAGTFMFHVEKRDEGFKRCIRFFLRFILGVVDGDNVKLPAG